MKLFDIMLQTANRLEATYTGVVTGTGGGTITDSLASHPENWWQGGTLFVRTLTQAKKTFRVVSSLAHTITYTPAAVPNIEVGALFDLARNHYTRADLVLAVNQALADMGKVTQTNSTTLVVAGQQSYALPAGVENVVMVETTQQTAAPYIWAIHYWWREIGPNLEFDQGKAPTVAGSPIRIYYNTHHAEVSADNDDISPVVEPARLTWAACYYALLERQKIVANDERLAEFIKTAQAEKALREISYPIKNYARTIHMANW